MTRRYLAQFTSLYIHFILKEFMKIRLTLLSLACVAAVNASAADFFDVASVVSAAPIMKDSPPKHICNDSPAYPGNQNNGTNVTGVAIGGVTGAIVGNQVGKGNGKVAATALGAVVGALAGNNIANNNANANRQPVQDRQCQWINDGSQYVVGYDVTYDYNNKRATVRMQRDPGQTIRVSVSAIPL